MEQVEKIVVGLIVGTLIATGAVVLVVVGGNFMSTQMVGEVNRDADLMNGPNLIAGINRLVEPDLVQDLELMRQAQERAEVLANAGMREGAFTTLSGQDQDYYSVQQYLKENPFTMSGTRVGAWVAYTIPDWSPEGKPVAYVVVLTN